MKIKIERLKKKDLLGFYKLFKQSLVEDFKEYSPEVVAFQWKRHRKNRLLKWVKSGDEYIFLAKNEEGRLVGVLMSQRIVGGVSYCDWLIVSHDFRGMGVGTKLVEFWEKWTRRNKGHLLILSSNKRNVSFYKKNGFVKYGHLVNGYFNEDDYQLCKKIGEWNKKSLSLKQKV